MDFITAKDIHIGDRVWIQRSGEVIPYVVGAITDRRQDTQAILAPKHCPVCANPITAQDSHYYCTNNQCPAIVLGKLEYFVAKSAMNIDGIGQSILQILIEQDIVHNIADLYKLTDLETQQLLKRLPGFGDKKITHMANEIQKSKSIELRRLINAL